MTEKKRRTKSRGNGTGTAYYSQQYRYWVAQVITGWRISADDKPLVPIKRTKGGFKTRDKALQYCPVLLAEHTGEQPDEMTLQQVYDAWEPWYAPRVDPSTMASYRAAYNYYASLRDMPITEITADDLQGCMDACPRGKRTKQNMKVVAGLLWKYAKSKHIVSQIESETLFTGRGQSVKRDALTDIEVEKICQAIGQHRYAEYIYCLCYLGFRPGEMLELRKDQVVDHKGTLFIIEGKKTEAGRGRTVPVHHKIEDIIRDRLMVPGTNLVFPMYKFGKPSKKAPVPLFTGFKQMTDNYFRESVFKRICAALGIAEGKVPYAARHTFSNKLKHASGDDIDKARLIGHSDYTFTQTKYQTTDLDELKSVVESMV
ncbi:MAG: tyrosine-type recombinase/integrase [Lachnospiraceae bacterium]|nr:tyrosine-type recombinase/integrase [Lachnospiraceae bacterium]